MKVALIADVHANLPALEAVLADARERGAETVWNLGDFVGYGPFPDQVVQRLAGGNAPGQPRQPRGAISIIGNYDRKVLAFEQKKDRWRRRKAPEKLLAFRWACENLSEASLAHLRSLPEQVRLEAAGLRVLLTHGSPADDDEPLGPDTTQGRLEDLAARAEADLVACGHSHQPFVRRAAGVWFVNPGSVGRPEGGDPRACYALLEIERADVDVDLRRVAYDVRRVVRAIRAAGLPEDFAEMLRQGRSFGEVGLAREIAPTAPDPAAAPPGKADCMQAVLALARRCGYEQEHTHQVTRLALDLFDALQPLHKLGRDERFRLQCGALLHDIGWIEGRKRHHKTSQRIILESSLPLGKVDRLIVALIARYHRKALPSPDHEPFASLGPRDRRRVCMLAGILRVADGLDRTHASIVRKLACEILPDRVVVRCDVAAAAECERGAAEKKGSLFEQVFGRKLTVETALVG